MTLQKIQKFLKNKHKFDHKPDMFDVIAKYDGIHENVKNSLKGENVPELKENLAATLTEIVMIANRFDIDLTELLKEKYNLN